MKRSTERLVVSLAAITTLMVSGLASATCYTVTRSPTWDGRWVYGSDGTPSWDDLSVLADNSTLKSTYPSQCGGTYGCDVVRYRIQWFNGTWSPDYYPGVNDVDWVTNAGGYQRRVWSYFYDHTHQFTFCN
jgi:hypothetical protein